MGKRSASAAPKATILIRFMVGAVFASEGVQKFALPDARGAGRFEKIGIPWPEVTGPVVGVVEIACGALVLAGACTRLAVLPLMSVMLVAIVTTKIPILLGESFWGLSLPELSSYGLMSAMHESRADLSMLLGSLYLFFVGPGPWSIDAWADGHRR